MSGSYLRGGQSLARLLLRPQAFDFIEEVSAATGLDVPIGEAIVAAGSRVAGTGLRGSRIREELDIIVTSMVKADGRRIFAPSPTERIEPGDLLISLGRPAAIDRLVALAVGSEE